MARNRIPDLQTRGLQVVRTYVRAEPRRHIRLLHLFPPQLDLDLLAEYHSAIKTKMVNILD
jgi:hypothetical protein